MQLKEQAHGKADLYFDAYFWLEYLKHLHQLQDKACKQPSLTKDGVKLLSSERKSSVEESLDESKEEAEESTDAKSGKKGKKNKKDKKTKVTKLPEVSKPAMLEASQKVELWDSEPGDKHVFMKRLVGLSLTLSKVIGNLSKYPFTQEIYSKYVRKFAAEASKYTAKNTKYLEEIQRCLFVA